ncbi:MoxR family ATPase [Paenibacillus pasadenensis]|uniref:AAA family ATPase n=1 Tax=Paenibacillus pasadenensis TaxID=217090 RepID=UPI00203FE27A|nr:MoxR family ATPase [Paenibacillus pasadenensis]MCM3748724.1 MoxR family ATPase [Paenibacillus pasadenensis]
MNHLLESLERRIHGQNRNIRLLVTALIAGGHVLLEGVPGLGKTSLARQLAVLSGCGWRRIQFTPDLLPGDITGSVTYNMQEQSFSVVKGPIFTNVLLADEINRSGPKTQAALLEAMEERQVTIQGTTYPLPEPFFVAATQNPVEYDGTYPLPEAQLDRFLFKLVLDYPAEQAEIDILRNHRQAAGITEVQPEPVVTAEEIRELQGKVGDVVVEDALYAYAAALVRATRETDGVGLGASPRAGIALLRAASAWALLEGRNYMTPDDIKEMALPVLRHRLLLTPQAELEGMTGESIIRQTLASVPVPR